MVKSKEEELEVTKPTKEEGSGATKMGRVEVTREHGKEVVKTNAFCSKLEDASAETSGGQQCKSGAAPLAHNFSYKHSEAEASDTEHQWACKDVLETIEAVPYHEVFIHSFGDYNTRGL